MVLRMPYGSSCMTFDLISMSMHRVQHLPNHAINSGVQKCRFALLLHAGYGER